MARKKTSDRQQPKKIKTIKINLGELQPLPHFTAPVWVDRMEVNGRSDMPIVTLRFLSMVSSQNTLEVFRAQTNLGHLKNMMDAFAGILAQYQPAVEPQK